jgi:hypothetical protein
MPHTRIVASTLACAICVGGRAHAQDTGQAAVNACRPAVTKKVQSVIAQAKGVEFISAAPALVSTTETSVTGSARYQDRSSGVWTEFIFQCTYNNGSGTASSVRLDRPSTTNPAVGGGDTTQAAISACHAAATKQLRVQVPQADRVRFLGEQLSQPSSAETAVTGTAQYVSRNSSTWTKVSYTCAYNAGSKQTNNVTVRENGPVGADDLAQTAITACQAAVSREVRSRYPNAVSVQFTSTPNRRQTSSAETVVSGSGQVQTSSDSRTFGYDCTYNSRSSQTSHVTIRSG